MRLITLFLVSLFTTNLYAASIAGASQCQIDIPYITPDTLPQHTDSEGAVHVSSDTVNIQYPNLLNFSGEVRFHHSDKFISANTAQYNELNNIFSASGNLHFQNSRLTINSQSLTTSLDGQNTELLNNKYWFNGTMINGSSDNFKVRDGRYLILNNALFTTCSSNSPDWALQAKEIRIDTSQAWATVEQATLEVFDIPVFYFPYLTMPISDKRSSGFLYPTVASTTENGVDISLPFYWNIATNYDMTITPRFMSKRGLQLNTQLRYLTHEQEGLLNIEYLHHDRYFDDSRYLVYWQHQGKINKNWRINTNLNYVSDDNYLNDISSDYGNSTDNQLLNNIELAYFSDDWWLTMRLQDIQVLGQQEKPFQLLPQLSFHSYNNLLGNYFQYDVFSELSHFTKNNNKLQKTSRLHIEPTLRLPLKLSSFNIVPEIKYMQTWYAQDNANSHQSISRNLPQFKLYSDISLIRNLTFIPEYTQTLIPKIQYLYVPFEHQENIGLYDTALLRDDYAGLFRARRFSGLDRIIDTEQVTIGLTTIIKDQHNKPRLTASLGQTLYLRDSKMAQQENNLVQSVTERSALAGELTYSMHNRWEFSHAIQLNAQQNAVTQSKSTIHYQINDASLVQLNHRFVKDINFTKINQLGVKSILPINHNWTFFGSYYRDINLHRTIESFAGLQYESCCWSISLQGYRQLQNHYNDGVIQHISENEQFDTGISFNFQIKGLGSQQKSNTAKMFNKGLFSYRKPYYLNN